MDDVHLLAIVQVSRVRFETDPEDAVEISTSSQMYRVDSKFDVCYFQETTSSGTFNEIRCASREEKCCWVGRVGRQRRNWNKSC